MFKAPEAGSDMIEQDIDSASASFFRSTSFMDCRPAATRPKPETLCSRTSWHGVTPPL